MLEKFTLLYADDGTYSILEKHITEKGLRYVVVDKKLSYEESKERLELRRARAEAKQAS